jgi:hypothetical protein
MAGATEIKPKEIGITADNLRYIAGLNGFTVTDLAARMDCSDSLLYAACREPHPLLSVTVAILPTPRASCLGSP